jgi:type IV secretory pathway component VirB8
MSTVILDTITGKSTATTITIGSTPVVSASANSMTIRGEGSAQTSIQQGLAKSWLVHNAASLQNSLNVSSITDISQGEQTISFSNSMANTNYVIAGLLGNNNNTASNTMNSTRPYQWNTSSFKSMSLYNSGVGAVTDYDHTDNMVVGDLA